MRRVKAVLLGFALLAAAGAAQAAGTLRIGTQEEPDRLDPALGGTFGGRFVFTVMCDKLWDLTPQLGFTPQLATKWEWSADGRALTVTLRDDVLFQDGEKMTAEAVAWNLERYRSAPESVRKGELKPLAGVEVVDGHTVRLKLSQPYAPLLAVLSDRAGMMVSPKAVEATGKDFANAPVCSGPYKFTERVAQDHIALDRFAGYRDQAALHFDRVIIRPTPNSTVRLVNLQGGQLDILQDLAPSDVGKVRGDARLKLATATGLGHTGIAFNLGNGPAADNPFGRDKRVRAALEAAIDRKVINQVVMDGLFVPTNQTEPPGSPYYDSDIPVPPRDLAKARALLKAAGVEHPVLDLMVPTTPRDQQVGEVIQSMAAEAGITVKVVAGEANANIAAMTAGTYMADINNWSGRADPDANISIYLAADSFQNWGKYASVPFNDALGRARAETDPAKRAAIYREVVSIYSDDRPMLYLYNVTWLFAHDARLKGFVPVPDGLIRVQGLSLE
jgi:peptide/nickel transport system substrate-binding protein